MQKWVAINIHVCLLQSKSIFVTVLCLSILNIDDTFLTLEDFQIEKDITFEILTSYLFYFVFRELFSQHEKSDTLVSGLLDEVGIFI